MRWLAAFCSVSLLTAGVTAHERALVTPFISGRLAASGRLVYPLFSKGSQDLDVEVRAVASDGRSLNGAVILSPHRLRLPPGRGFDVQVRVDRRSLFRGRPRGPLVIWIESRMIPSNASAVQVSGVLRSSLEVIP